MIVFDHVSKQFPGGSSAALHDLTVTIGDGEFVFLIGPSGAGKSTILRLILRDLVPTSGMITVNGMNLPNMPSSQIHLLRRSVGMIFQDFKLLMDRTVFENIAIGLEILGKPSSEIEKGVSDVLELVGLPHKHKSFPLQLSAGELQRVSIARAIIGGPTILLADEPTGNLDPETGWGILTILKEINAMGTTVVMATHNDAFVNQLKKRTLTIRDGRILHDEEKGKYHMAKHEKREEREKAGNEEAEAESEHESHHHRHHEEKGTRHADEEET